MRIPALILPCLLALPAGPLRAVVPRDYAVDLKAAVSDTAPHIVLSWTQRLQSNITAQKIHRRLKGEATWVKQADLTTTQTSYTDNTAMPGVEYEYWMERTFTGLSPNTAMGYLSAGVKVPEVHSRGTLLLLVDDTLAAPLAPEIDQLKLDLAGDGWNVQTLTAPRAGTAIGTKALITAAYNADPTNVKAVYLLGHVPVPYSGNLAPDGHSNHVGAWPADGYYGDVDGTWTDTSVNNTSASRTQNDNIPGDGKFDQVSFPSLVELQVGRVDMQTLARSPASGVTELARMRRYLHKAHDFRHKQGPYASIPRSTLIRDGFGFAFNSEPFAVTAWAGAFSAVDDTAIDEAPAGQWFSPSYAGGKDYLWGHGCGGGNYEYAASLGTSTDFGHLTSRVVFTSVFGSYHGDWDSDSNLMRSVLAGNPNGDSLGLTCFWAGRPNWFPHHLGMGETVGFMTRVSMNAGLTGGGSYTPGGSSFRGIHIALMGDPALRMHAVEPPRHLTAASTSGQVFLNWAASSESALQGYHVYRATTPAGPFAKLTSSPLAITTFNDSTVTAGSAYTYLVRTLKLESVPGGSYYNLSVASPVTITASNIATAPPLRPTELTVMPAASSTSAALSWADNASDETAFRVERRTNAGGAYAPVATPAANATGWTDPGPFSNGNVYYYRVFATGAAGDSPASNEVSFEAVAGFVEFTLTKTRVNKGDGSVTLSVNRFGGAVGAVAVSCATANSSALAGTHYTSNNSTLNWADGETGARAFTVSVTNTPSPQLPRQFKVNLSSPTNGAALGQWSSVAVLIEDPTAPLDAPWSQTMLGSITESSPAVSAEGVIGDATMGGSGVSSGSTSEAGRFIYQSRTGDGIMTLQVPTSAPSQGGARYAIVVRGSTSAGDVMAAAVATNSAANLGTWLAYRTSSGGSASIKPSADNNQDTPQWLRLGRAGNTFTAESSPDGTNWITLGSATVTAMPASALWGIFHCSNDQAISSTYLGDYQLGSYQNTAITGLPVPAAPGAPVAGTATAASVPLTWTAVPYSGGYRIERSADDGSYDLVADITSGATTSFTDTSVAADTAYRYRIVAYNSSGTSDWSGAVTATTPPPDIVTNITADASSGADTLIRADNPATNYGGADSLPVTDTSIGAGDVSTVTKAWLRFDLGSLPAIKSAKLKLGYLGEQDLQAAFDAESYYYMLVRVLSEASDTWDENTITWNNAPQNNTATSGVTGTAPSVGSYYVPDYPTLPPPNTVVSMTLTASTLNASRGANNLLTFALVPAAGRSGAMIWASREHATLPPPTLEIASASTQPVRPGFLTATPGGGGTVLAWSDGGISATGYEIQRRAANGDWMLIASPGAGSTGFTDTTALPGVIYEYRVRSVNSGGYSSWATIQTTVHASGAKITFALSSSNGTTAQRADAPAGNAYVPTGFMFYTPASTFVTSVTLSTFALRNNISGWLGTKITTGTSPVIVRELGRWVVSGNTGTHTVKVVNAATSTDVPGASVSVATAGAPVGFSYTALNVPVTLAANTSYYIVSQEVIGGDQWYDGNNTLSYPASVATVNQSAYSLNGTTYSTSYSVNNSFVPVSFKYSSAASPFIYSHGMTALRNDYTGWLGMEITVGGTPMLVSALGRWVVNGNTGAHAVRLVDGISHDVLASATVNTLGATPNQFQYAPLTSGVTLAAGAIYYVLSEETAGGDQWYDFAQAASGSASGYQQWLWGNGLPMDESGSGSATATPANDDLPNLVKYALGLPALSSGDGGRLAYGSVNVTGSEYLGFTYTRPEPAPSGITYAVEACDDLAPESWSSTGILPVSSTVNSGLRTITVRDNVPMAGGSRRFMRLKITNL